MIEVRDLIGIPYKVHGRNADGIDCYGLAIEVLRRYGITLPDVFYDDTDKCTCEKLRILGEGLPLIEVQKPTEKCIILMSLKGYESHIAVYLGEGMIIHATKQAGVICEDYTKYQKRITGYYKIGEE